MEKPPYFGIPVYGESRMKGKEQFCSENTKLLSNSNMSVQGLAVEWPPVEVETPSFKASKSYDCWESHGTGCSS